MRALNEWENKNTTYKHLHNNISVLYIIEMKITS